MIRRILRLCGDEERAGKEGEGSEGGEGTEEREEIGEVREFTMTELPLRLASWLKVPFP